MRRKITYILFTIASILVVMLFVTAKNYIQLAVAVLLYPVLAYFAIKIFPRKAKPVTQLPIPVNPQPVKVDVAGIEAKSQDILDIDKRTFIKLIGATGIFFFLSSLFGKWTGALPFGKSLGPGVNTQTNSTSPGSGNSGSLAANGYQISEIDDGVVTFYGFTNRDGSWLIMKEDTDTNSFRYSKGSSGFPENWKNRSDLRYDYYYNLF